MREGEVGGRGGEGERVREFYSVSSELSLTPVKIRCFEVAQLKK